MYTGPVFEGLILEAVRVQRHYLLCPRSDIPTNLPSSKFPAKGKILNCILCIWQHNRIRIKYGKYGRIRNTVVQKWSWSRENDGTNYRVVLALLTRRLSNFRAITQFLAQISWFRDSARKYLLKLLNWITNSHKTRLNIIFVSSLFFFCFFFSILNKHRRQAIIWTNADPVHWRIYAALGGDELTIDHMLMLPHCGLVTPHGDINLVQHWLW